MEFSTKAKKLKNKKSYRIDNQDMESKLKLIIEQRKIKQLKLDKLIAALNA